MNLASKPGTDYSSNMEDSFRPNSIVIVNCVLNAPLILISIVGNTLVLASILRCPSLRLASAVLLCSLATSDFTVGFVVQPLYIAFKLTGNLPLYQALSVMAAAGTGVSLLVMTAISVDRLLALHYHMRYPSLMTMHRAIYTSVTLWLIVCLLSLLFLWKMRVYYLTAAIIIVTCLLVSTGCYIQICRIVRQHQLQIHAQRQAVEILNSRADQDMQQVKKSAKNTFIYYVVMILCYSPSFISMLILSISPNHWTNIWGLTDTVAFMNSSINPFLYCWRICELRKAVVKTARDILCKQSVANPLT